MDTRSKIVAPADAIETARRLRAQGRTLALTTGWFDPLVSAHARRLSGLKDRCDCLVVLISEPGQPLLPDRVDALIAEISTASVSRGEAEDEQIARDLIRHVHTRQGVG